MSDFYDALFIGLVLKPLLGHLIRTRFYGFKNHFSSQEHIQH